MLVGVLVIVLGVGGIVLGGLQLVGRLPGSRRGIVPNYSAYVNCVVGTALILLGALRLVGTL